MKTLPLLAIAALLVLAVGGCDLVGSPGGGEPLELVWAAPYQNQLDAINLEPVVLAGHVVAGADLRAAALDPETGREVWAVGRPTDGRGGAAISSGTGETEWLADGQSVFLVAREGRAVHAYDAASGAARWAGPVPDSLRLYPFSQGATDETAVYTFAAGRETHVVRLSKAEGRVLGVFDVPGVPKVALRVGGTLVVGTDWGGTDDGAGAVVGLDPETGAERWRYEVAPGTGGFSYAPLQTDGRRVWASTVFGSGATVCLDAATGEVVWDRLGARAAEADLAETPDGLRYFVNDGVFVRAYDAETGRPVWTVDFEGYSEDNLAYADGVVYHAHGYTLYALDAAMGAELASVVPEGGPTWDLEVDPSRRVLYLMTSVATEARRLLSADDRQRLAEDAAAPAP